MNIEPGWSQRIVAMESLIAHLQHDLDQLNSVLLRQQTEIDALRQSQNRLEMRIDDNLTGAEDNDPSNERPPHY
ncbi:MAG: SlyX family protein [Planctomycetes bacterium]|nr:SlyX family protein [Planctomycetota bacterium]